jgi:hypothetical protein
MVCCRNLLLKRVNAQSPFTRIVARIAGANGKQIPTMQWHDGHGLIALRGPVTALTIAPARAVPLPGGTSSACAAMRRLVVSPHIIAGSNYRAAAWPTARRRLPPSLRAASASLTVPAAVAFAVHADAGAVGGNLTRRRPSGVVVGAVVHRGCCNTRARGPPLLGPQSCLKLDAARQSPGSPLVGRDARLEVETLRICTQIVLSNSRYRDRHCTTMVICLPVF